MRSSLGMALGLSIGLSWAAAGQTVVNGGRTILGRWDASTAVSTKPSKSGTVLPSTCSVGEQYFKTDASAGQNLFLCTAPDVWTVLTGAGGGGGLTDPGSNGVVYRSGPNTTRVTAWADLPGHGPRHKSGGDDEVASSVPAANAIPKADGTGTLATGWIPTLNQNTTGTAAGLSAQYVDWNASSGGASIANKPTLLGYPGAGVASSTGSAWGTSYTVGTSANNLVQLNASSQLPAVSAALLTSFPTLNQNTTGTAAGITGKTFVGTATQIPLLSGTPAGSKCVHTDASGNLTEAPADCGSGGGLADPGASGVIKRTALNTTAVATAADMPAPGDCTTIVAAGTDGIATPATGSKVCVTGNQSSTAAIALSNPKVVIQCVPGVTITRATAGQNLFALTASDVTVRDCILDGGSQTGGSAIAVSSNPSRVKIEENYFQNWGTSSGAGIINVASGQQVTISGNAIPAYVDHAINLNASESGAIVGAKVRDNTLVQSGTTDNVVGIRWFNNSTYHVNNLEVRGNRVTTNAQGYYTNDNTGVYNQVVGNHCQWASTTNYKACFDLYGGVSGTVIGNTAWDGGFGKGAGTMGLYNLHDLNNSTVVGNVAYFTGTGAPYGFNFLDSKNSVIAANAVYGGKTTSTAFRIATSASGGNGSISNNKIADNLFVAPANFTGTFLSLTCTNSGNLCSNNSIIGPHAIGTSTSGSTGVALVQTNGTMDGNFIGDYLLKGFLTGISIGAGVSNTAIGDGTLSGATTAPISNAGTATRVNGMFAQTYAQINALGALANGSNMYCSDCTIAACATAGTGSFSRFLNGALACY